ncbi:hypothetical protein B5X24_HaOG213067 [Helicoverpa armigera]|nr:hypothetical protein B5X24_HaOG213067 [Helicoverpa armigera]
MYLNEYKERIEWKEKLAAPTAGHWTAAATGPILEEWVRRRYGVLSFRITQILTHHGCFGFYLHKVARREPTPVCHQCGSSSDTAHHIIELCSARDEKRNALAAYTGQDFSLPNFVRVMIGSEAGWKAVDTFCEQVISQKEAAERVREADAHADPIRRRRVGRHRTRYAAQMPP